MIVTDEQVLIGRARDLVTPRRGDAVVVDEGSFTARVGAYRSGQPIEELSASPAIDGLDGLAGRSAARGYRRELQRIADEQGLVGRAVYQLLDDVPGASLVAGYSPELNRRDADRTGAPRVEATVDDGEPPPICSPSPACAPVGRRAARSSPTCSPWVTSRSRSAPRRRRWRGPTTRWPGTSCPTRSHRTGCAVGAGST